MSPTKGRSIGRGRLAEVFAWGDDQAIKLFYPGRPRKLIENEAYISQIALGSGLNTPAVGEVVEVDGRHGIVFELVEGTSMLSQIGGKPWLLVRYARILAEQQAHMHGQKATHMPAQRELLAQSIRSADALSTEQKESGISAAEELPDGDAICHGDFHPDNVIISRRGAITIDWTTASRGNPLADVARTSLLLRLGELPPGTPAMMRGLVAAGRGLFHRTYLKRYFELRPGSREKLSAWQFPIVCVRLGDGIVEEYAQLLALLADGTTPES